MIGQGKKVDVTQKDLLYIFLCIIKAASKTVHRILCHYVFAREIVIVKK